MKLILILTTLLLTTDLHAQARAPKPKASPTIYHYYGVQKESGALQLLASSADPLFFGKTYGAGESASQLFNTFAIVYRSTAKLSQVNSIWKDDHGQPGIRWNQHVEVPSSPPMPTRQWANPNFPGIIPGVTQTNSMPPEPPLPAGGASVLPDTQPPVVTGFVECGNITNFPTHVLFRSNLASGGYWTDPENAAIVGRIFDVTFPVHSNEFITAWSSNNLIEWKEYPTPLALHPSRINTTNAMYFPIAANGHRFFTLRSYEGGARTTWQ